MQLDLDLYFTSQKMKTNSFIWRWNLNNTPSDPAERILIMSELIKKCRHQNQNINLRPDKRIRAKGLYVLFANNIIPPE
jgi:hypothetical protein